MLPDLLSHSRNVLYLSVVSVPLSKNVFMGLFCCRTSPSILQKPMLVVTLLIFVGACCMLNNCPVSDIASAVTHNKKKLLAASHNIQCMEQVLNELSPLGFTYSRDKPGEYMLVSLVSFPEIIGENWKG